MTTAIIEASVEDMIAQSVDRIANPYQVTSDALGPSKIGTYLKCGLAYKLAYVDRLQARPNAVMVAGSAIHETIAIAHSCRWTAAHAADAAHTVLELWEQLRETTSGEKLATADKRIELAVKVWLPGYLRWSADHINIATEHHWHAEYQGVKLEGTIDRAYRYGGLTVISDIKTGNVPGNLATDLQLTIYDWAWAQDATPADAQEIVQMETSSGVPSPQGLRTTRTAEYRAWAMDSIVVPVAEAIGAGNFAANPNPLYGCDYCNQKSNCPAGQGGIAA